MHNAWLSDCTEAGPLDDLIGHSITYRTAAGPRAGQKLFSLHAGGYRTPDHDLIRAGAVYAGVPLAAGEGSLNFLSANSA